jgi:hypothetical protein
LVFGKGPIRTVAPEGVVHFAHSLSYLGWLVNSLSAARMSSSDAGVSKLPDRDL